MNPHAEPPPSPTDARFPVTNWSVVVSARDGDEARARAALEDLCRAYWPPLYAEIRRRGHSPADAQDLTQELFARLLQHQSFGTADRNRGRFRSFLLGALNHLLADDWRERCAEKRGGGVSALSFDAKECEAWLQNQPVSTAGPAELFDQRWALILMERAFDVLRAEYATTGRGQHFETLKPFLAAEAGSNGYAAASAQAGMTAEAFAVAVHRLRKRFRSAVREQVTQTVTGEAEAATELRHLFGV